MASSTTKTMYRTLIRNLRGLLKKIGRHEFRAMGYAVQLREYRAAFDQE